MIKSTIMTIKNIANNDFETLLTRFIVTSLFIGVMATIWDVWWHGFVGRDTLFEPPHIFLYTFVTLAIIGGVYGWYRMREKVWKRLAIILLIVPASAPFDEFWHRLYGVENLSTPLIIWAPPHLALVSATVISWILLLPLVNREKDVHARRFFGGIIFAAILISTLGMTAPFQPIGPYHVIGFWGAGMLAAVFAGVLLTAQKWIGGLGSAMIVSIFYLLLFSVGTESREIARDVIIPPHGHSPGWLIVFSILVPAFATDVNKSLPTWIRGALIGVLWAGILFGFSSQFTESGFEYGLDKTLIAVFTSFIGGIIGGVFVSKLKF